MHELVMCIIVKAFLHLFHSVPPGLTAHCEYWAAGYSIRIVWNKPVGMWTDVEVNVTGKPKKIPNTVQYIVIPGFLPARTYEVSLASFSGTVRSSEPFVFKCSTDPRGESVFLYVHFYHYIHSLLCCLTSVTGLA